MAKSRSLRAPRAQIPARERQPLSRLPAAATEGLWTSNRNWSSKRPWPILTHWSRIARRSQSMTGTNRNWMVAHVSPTRGRRLL
jgi:hypothetical protein